MKQNLFVSTFAAVSAAFTLVAVNPSPAHAQGWGDAFTEISRNLEHQTSTCSRAWYHSCHESIQDWVLILADEVHEVYAPLSLPQGSNGTDQEANDWLTENVERDGEDSPHYRVRERIFREDGAPARVVTPVAPLESVAEIANIVNHRFVTRVNRSEIVELQREVNAVGGSLDYLSDNMGLVMGGIDALGEFVDENMEMNTAAITGLGADVDMNSVGITNLGADVRTNSAGITNLDTNVRMNTAGIENLDTDVETNSSAITNLGADVRMNATAIRDLGADVETNTSAITEQGEDVRMNTASLAGLVEETSRNTAGVALSLALDSQPLHYNKSYAISGGMGHFSGEVGVGFSFTGKLSDNVFGNFGAGFAGSGDSSVQGVKGNLSFQW